MAYLPFTAPTRGGIGDDLTRLVAVYLLTFYFVHTHPADGGRARHCPVCEAGIEGRILRRGHGEHRASLAQTLAQPYNLLLVDWMLPGLTGLEVCWQLRAQQYVTPIIFLTAKDTVADTIAGLQAGANDYIKKPFHFEELLERIRVQLHPAAGPAE